MTKVLYVDDEPALLELGKIYLGLHGPFQVDIVESAKQALTLLQQQDYDAVVSDYQMPEMDGIELLKRVRITFSNIPFILFTGKGREEVVIEAINQGADFYLQKGGDPKAQFAELAHKIRHAIKVRIIQKQTQEIVEGSPVPIYVINEEHRVIYWNRAMEEFTGISATDIIGTDQTWRAFYDNERPCLADLLVNGENEKIPQWYGGKFVKSSLVADAYEVIDFFPKMKGGRWLFFTAAPIRDSHGSIIGSMETFQDITSLRHKEEELKTAYEQMQAAFEEARASQDTLIEQNRRLEESEQRYRNVVEDQTEFICRFRPDGTHVFVNEAYCRYFGKRREEILNHRFVPEIPKEDLQQVNALFTSITPEHPVVTIEHRITLPNGETRWHLWIDRAVFNEQGEIIEYQSVGRDITDRKTAELNLLRKNEELGAAYEQLTAIEEELRTSFDELAKSQRELEENQSVLSAIIQESPIPQFVIDRNHKVIHWNRALAEYSGIPAEDMVGTSRHWKAFYDAERPCMADLLLKGLTEKIPEWYKDKYAKSALIADAYEATDFFPHQEKWLHFTAGLIRNKNGDITGAVETLEDITDRKNAELNLLRKNEELGSAYEQLTAIEEELRTSFDELAKSQRELEENQSVLSAIIQESPIPQFVIDRNHKVIHWNRALAEYSGIPAEDMVGTSRHWKAFYDAERPCMADLLLNGLTEKIPEWYKDKYAKSALIADAYEATDFFPNQSKWLHFTAGLIRNKNGDVTGAVETLEDITDRKNAELNLLRKNEELGTAYEQLTAIEEELRTSFDELAKSQRGLEERHNQNR
jgi:PAS domain S-box-containing protein